jgi:hypothetical protein
MNADESGFLTDKIDESCLLDSIKQHTGLDVRFVHNVEALTELGLHEIEVEVVRKVLVTETIKVWIVPLSNEKE